MINYYATLGVLPEASAEEIKASYRQLAKRYHPDMRGGNPQTFARVRAAYDALSEPVKRTEFDRMWRAEHERRRRAQQAEHEQQMAASQTAAQTSAHLPIPMLTRVMSIAMPRSGRFQMDGIIGKIQVEPTRPDGLWDTTLRKFRDIDPERLARHVIQVKLTGERTLVQTIMPRPTDFGVEMMNVSEEERRKPGFWRHLLRSVGRKFSLGDLFEANPFGAYGAFLPLALHMTVPEGIPIVLRNVTGAVTLGDMRSEVVANMLGGVLRAGVVSRASVTLHGSSRAYLSAVEGPADVMAFGDSQLWLDGKITRLRAVVDNNGLAEVRCTVPWLMAEVNGNGVLDVKNTVGNAHCDVRGQGYVRLAHVRQALQGTKSGGGRVDAYVRPKVRPPPAQTFAKAEGFGG
jgi:hypothetical protein